MLTSVLNGLGLMEEVKARLAQQKTEADRQVEEYNRDLTILTTVHVFILIIEAQMLTSVLNGLGLMEEVKARLAQQKSFFPRTIAEWNLLSPSTDTDTEVLTTVHVFLEAQMLTSVLNGLGLMEEVKARLAQQKTETDRQVEEYKAQMLTSVLNGLGLMEEVKARLAQQKTETDGQVEEYKAQMLTSVLNGLGLMEEVKARLAQQKTETDRQVEEYKAQMLTSVLNGLGLMEEVKARLAQQKTEADRQVEEYNRDLQELERQCAERRRQSQALKRRLERLENVLQHTPGRKRARALSPQQGATPKPSSAATAQTNRHLSPEAAPQDLSMKNGHSISSPLDSSLSSSRSSTPGIDDELKVVFYDIVMNERKVMFQSQGASLYIGLGAEELACVGPGAKELACIGPGAEALARVGPGNSLALRLV
ncbi:hypothetical protein Bbelb_248010 [Branchiostoma belcheri]|nr:hypothetical protein Bbelb_248010 [Branchiostoma belcheri]